MINRFIVAAVAALLLLCSVVTAQCTFTTGITTVTSNACNNIGGGQTSSLWLAQALSSSNGGAMLFSWANLPTPSPAPAFFQTFIAIDLAYSPVPVPSTISCPINVAPGLFLLATGVVQTGGGSCQAQPPSIVVPPLPGLVGLPVYFQGFIRDAVQDQWATTRVLQMTFQP